MSVDKLVDSTQLDADLTSVANAIRTKGGTSAALAFPSGFVQAIADIPSGGGGDSEAGAITVASQTDTIVVPVSKLFTHFAIIRYDKKANWVYANVPRTVMFAFGESDWYCYGDTNNSGGDRDIGDRTPGWRNDKIAFTASQITCKVLGNGAIAEYPATATYAWAAWNEAQP